MGFFSRVAGWLKLQQQNKEDLPARSSLADDPYRSSDVMEEHSRWQTEAIQRFSNLSKKEMLASLSQGTNPEILLGASYHKDAAVRRIAATHHDTPLDGLRLLAADMDAEVQASVASNRSTPGDALVLLAQAAPLASALAMHPNAPEELLQQFALRNDPSLNRLLAQNPNIPMSVLESFLQSNDAWLRSNALHNHGLRQRRLARLSATDISTEELTQFSRDPSYEIRSRVAAHERCPSTILERLAQDSQLQVRQAAAKNTIATPALLLRLAHDRSPAVREATVSNPNTPEGGLRVAYDKIKNPSRAFQLALLAHANTPGSILQEYTTSRVESYRLLVAKHPKTTQDQLEILRNDRAPRVKKAAQESYDKMR
jgi:hypothetical protein